MKLWNWLIDPAVTPNTQTCRLKVWAHDNAFTMYWILAVNAVGWIVTVWTCH